MYVLRALRHGRFVYSPKDMIGALLDAYGEWSENELSFLLSLLGPSDYAADVGAHIGTFTVPMARKVGPEGRILAFEAQRFAYHNLVTNVYLNLMHNVLARNVVCARESYALNLEEVPLHQRQNSGGFAIATAARQSGTWSTTPAEPLDVLLAGLPRLRLIKIDVEGFENEVLAGARGTIARLNPIIHCECQTEASFSTLKQLADDAGYALFGASFPPFNARNYLENPNPINVKGGQGRDLNVLMWPADQSRPARLDLDPVRSFDELTAARSPLWRDATAATGTE